MDGPGGGGSATPVTCAPSRSSHSDSQPPLKPVWPVTSTRLPAKALPKSTDSRRSDMEHGRRMRLGEPRFARKLHPGRGALARQPVKVVPIADSVHRVPETVVLVGEKFRSEEHRSELQSRL